MWAQGLSEVAELPDCGVNWLCSEWWVKGHVDGGVEGCGFT